VRPEETLSALSGKTAPGRTPEFTSAHVLIALRIIREKSPGRKQLSADLCLGEGTVRNLLRRLTEEGLVSSTRRGVSLTPEGEGLLEELARRIRGRPVPRSRLTVGEFNHAVLVKGGAAKVRLGVEQRDHALISGASGATTLVFEDGVFRVPALTDAVESPVVESILELAPEEGDAVVIGTADHVFFAELGAYAAGLELLS
jgi:DNA-binding MarR family transcriptional regulator